MDYISFLDNFGVFRLNLSRAARLICVDLWFSGQIEVEVPEAESYSPEDPRFDERLKKHIKIFEERLIQAVARGKLDTV